MGQLAAPYMLSRIDYATDRRLSILDGIIFALSGQWGMEADRLSLFLQQAQPMQVEGGCGYSVVAPVDLTQ